MRRKSTGASWRRTATIDGWIAVDRLLELRCFRGTLADRHGRSLAHRPSAGYHAPPLNLTELMLRFLIIFMVVCLGLFAFEVSVPGEKWVVNPFTSVLASFSTWLITLFDDNVLSYGKIIQSTTNGFAVSIERGCNGLEAVIILIAAVVAFPARWHHKLVGLLAGFLAIQALNLVRIISLFYLGQHSMIWFEWFHLYLWQALIILDAVFVWLIWLRWVSRRDPRLSLDRPQTAAA
jgi:exosortase H (IPTLxxWG-CTERM-specific)